ncbi:MAG: dipeptidyl-peptidase 3 family protein [Candidatus Cyclobacteriaceae bacterium M3_2C_046]
MRIRLFIISLIIAVACKPAPDDQNTQINLESNREMAEKVAKYDSVKLTADLTYLSDQQKLMIPLLIQASDLMNQIFWQQAYGKRDSLMNQLDDVYTRQFVEINYGPWDRLADNEPFIPGVGPKPLGANFYPVDMTKEEFEAADLPDKTSQYTLIRRDEQGRLLSVPYHVAYQQRTQQAADLLRKAAELAEDPGFRDYLELRAEALLTDDYQTSDLAWMDMTNNKIDLVIGPIETYEDKLYGYKAAHEAYVLIKDEAWSQRLEKYAQYMPELQQNLPVPAKYKQEQPGSDAQLNAYDVVYYAGDCNAGSKTIAINLPNDEEVQLKKGTRRLQLKNAMRAKFDQILVPIAEVLIDEEQQQHITFDAFFGNTMFHEVAHGLGIKNTINQQGTVRQALKDNASAIEEGKADILGLYMINQLYDKGEIEGDLMDYYVTFMAGIFRSVRFGAASAHGKANMIRFNFFKEYDAFQRDEQTGRYKIDFENMQEAMSALSARILTLQGEGDYAGAKSLVDEQGIIDDQLQLDLEKLNQQNIPVDIVFQQGENYLTL